MTKLYIIKVGGNVMDDDAALEKFLIDFSSLKEPKILVHGGGKMSTALASQLGVSQKLVNGRRITDSETLKIITMVYAGLLNKRIVATLQSKSVNAIGLTGADANTIRASKRINHEIDFGFVGDINPGGINIEQIIPLLNRNLVPVFCAVTHDGQGQLFNTNADTIASALAIALTKKYAVQLHYCFEKKGVLQNTEDEHSVIPVITRSRYADLLASEIISRGMIPKLDNAFDAISKGVEAIYIQHSADLLQADAGTKLVATE